MRYLITGNAGTGKTSVSQLLRHRDYNAYDADEEFGHWIHKETGDTVKSRPAANRGDYYWVWDIEKIDSLLKKSNSNPIFFCGLAIKNQAQLYKEFDKIIVLNCDLETIKHRLQTRTNNPFGKRSGDLEWVSQTQIMLQSQLQGIETINIDASQPIDAVVDEIIEATHA